MGARSTFLKRKGGLFKKAHELSVLCSVDVAVIIFGNNKKLYEYSSSDMGEILTRYQYVRSTVRASLTIS
jgi:MADS-box transcription factor